MPSPIGGDNLCGAKTRSGQPCKNKPMANGRCAKHGGKSTGPPKGSKNAVTHGIYAKSLRGEEFELWFQIDVDGVDDEIRLLKIQIARTANEMGMVMDNPNDDVIGFVLSEIKEKRIEIHKAPKQSVLSEPGEDATEEEIEKWAEREDEEYESGKPQLNLTVESNSTRKRPDYMEILIRLFGRLAQLMQTKNAKRQVDNQTEYLKNLRELEELKNELLEMKASLQ